MGQYHLPVNLDKHEFLNPHQLGCGLKLGEMANTPWGVLPALFALVTASNGYGGGDFAEEDDPERQVIGRWKGDRIAIVGDYAKPTDLAPEHHADSIYFRCRLGQYPDDYDEAYLAGYRHRHLENYGYDPLLEPPYTNITPLVIPFLERAFDLIYPRDKTGWVDVIDKNRRSVWYRSRGQGPWRYLTSGNLWELARVIPLLQARHPQDELCYWLEGYYGPDGTHWLEGRDELVPTKAKIRDLAREQGKL